MTGRVGLGPPFCVDPLMTNLASADPLIDCKQARQLLRSIGKTKFYAMIRDGELPEPTKLGRRSFWRQSAILAYIDRLTDATKA